MTSAEIRRYVKDRVAFWRPIVGLDRWAVTVEFDEHEHLATAVAAPEYLTLALNFNVQRIMEKGAMQDYISEMCLHELCHALTWHLARGFKDEAPDKWVSHQEELATSSVARAIWRAKYGKEAP